MAFLRTLFWIVVTIVVVVFSLRNWVPVTINLFGDLRADVKLPVLLLIAFLLGFLPLYAWHHLVRFRYRRAIAAGRAAPLTGASPLTAAPLAGAPLAGEEAGFGPARAD